MTDAARAGFSNLILLCTPHHNVVDRRHPADYPAEVLRAWKTDHEGAAGVPPLPVTESTLLNAIRDVAKHTKPHREATIEFKAALLTPAGPIGGPFQSLARMRASPDLAHAIRLVVTTIRNTGGLPIAVEAVDLHFALTVTAGQTEPGDVVMLGRNDIAVMNPVLPPRLPLGEAMHWYLSEKTIAALPDGIQDTGTQAVIHHVFAWVRPPPAIPSNRTTSPGRTLLRQASPSRDQQCTVIARKPPPGMNLRKVPMDESPQSRRARVAAWSYETAAVASILGAAHAALRAPTADMVMLWPFLVSASAAVEKLLKLTALSMAHIDPAAIKSHDTGSLDDAIWEHVNRGPLPGIAQHAVAQQQRNVPWQALCEMLEGLCAGSPPHVSRRDPRRATTPAVAHAHVE
jgi:hypothetical protein